MWQENEITTKSGRVLCSHAMYLRRMKLSFSSVRRSDRPRRRRDRKLGTAPDSINRWSGGAMVGHWTQLNATSCPRSSSTIAARLHSSSLPPQGRPCIVEKKAIRIVSISHASREHGTHPFRQGGSMGAVRGVLERRYFDGGARHAKLYDLGTSIGLVTIGSLRQAERVPG